MGVKEDSVRERILTASLSLLKSFGIRKLAQPQIAKKAGVPQGHMTYYFPTRADLLMAVADRSLEQVAKVLTKKMADNPGLGPGDGLAIVEPLVSDVSRTRMLVGLLVESDENPSLRKKLRDNLSVSYSLIALGTGHGADSSAVRLASAAIMGLALQEFLMSPSKDRADQASLAESLSHLHRWLEINSGEKSSPPLGPPKGIVP